MFENAPLGIAIIDREYRLVRTNPAYRQMVGYSEEELVGRKVKELLHPNDRSKFAQLRTRARQSDRDAWRVEKRYIHKSGAIVHAVLTTTVLRDAQGDLQAAIGLVEDITEQRRAEEEQRRLEEKLRKAQHLE